MNRDLAIDLIALALSAGCAWFAIATASPRELRRAPERRRSPTGAPAFPPPTTETAPERDGEITRPTPAVADAGDRTRPRIFTGEPAPDERDRSAGRRALTLIAGLTAMAALGAIGLIVLVKGLVAMFQ